MLQLSQVNLLFVPCPFKSVKLNIYSATMSGPQHKLIVKGFVLNNCTNAYVSPIIISKFTAILTIFSLGRNFETNCKLYQ